MCQVLSRRWHHFEIAVKQVELLSSHRFFFLEFFCRYFCNVVKILLVLNSNRLCKAVALQVLNGILTSEMNKITSSTMTCHGLLWIPMKNAVILHVCTCLTSIINFVLKKRKLKIFLSLLFMNDKYIT